MEKSGNDSGERYVVHMDDKFGSLALIDIDAEADAVTVPWFNQTLTTVNKALVRLGVFRGEYHWHKHDEQDEFFLVIDGELHLDVEGREAVVLQKHQGYTVPKGVLHRTRAPERCVCVMIEEAGIVPTGD
jgi:mannose-6-phosphate isomerase-like protein (cupin superfamily)